MAGKEDLKIYVAGHGGLLGSAATRALQARNFRRIVTRTRAELDLRDQKATFAFLESERPDRVFLCAARVGGIQANMAHPGGFLFDNLAIQTNVIEGARRAGVKKLLFVASSCVYPNNFAGPIPEGAILSGPFEPTNEAYAVAKFAGLKLCSSYRREYGCDFITAIPASLYGLNDTYDPLRSHLVPALIAKFHAAKASQAPTVTLWGSGRPRRELMSSDDCADALLFLMEQYSSEESINVGTGTDLEVREIAALIGDVIGWKGELAYDASKPDGMMRKLLDVGKLTSLGWRSGISLREGVSRTYRDYLDSGTRYKRYS